MTWNLSSSLTMVTALPLIVLISGCASVHVDDQGRTHVVGFVWMTLPPSGDLAAATSKAADVVRARSVGVTLQRGPDGGALVIGYSDATLSTIYNDSVVQLPPDRQVAKKEE